MLKTRKSVKRNIETVTQITNHVNGLLAKEKHQGVAVICLQKDGDLNPVFPWSYRLMTLESAVLKCYESTEETGKPVLELSITDVEAVLPDPFDISYYRQGVLHVLAIKSSEEEKEKWIKAINTSRQLIHLVTPNAFQKKTSTPSAVQPTEELQTKIKRIVSFTEMSLEKEREKAAEEKKREKERAIEREREREQLEKDSKDPLVKIWYNFLLSLREAKGFITELEEIVRVEDMRDIFSNFDSILNTSEKLYEAFRRSRRSLNSAKEFKSLCQELEGFSSFCSNRDLSLKQLDGLNTILQDNDKISKLKKLFFSPTEVILELSTALREFAESNQNLEQSLEEEQFLTLLDESSAVLQDIHDYIQSVISLFSDWINNTENKFLKSFLSPAKRALLLVDTTASFPVALFNDFLIIFKKTEKEGKTISQIHMKIPISLVEIEGTTKTTKILSSTLGITCSINSPNNQTANNLRRKVLETKTKYLEMATLKISKKKEFGQDIPSINTSLIVDHKLLLGTDRGLYLYDFEESTINLIANTSEHKIDKIFQSKTLRILIYSVFSTDQNSNSNSLTLFSYPLLFLTEPPTIQRHLFPLKIETIEKLDLYTSFDLEDMIHCVVTSFDSKIKKHIQNETDFSLSKEIDLRSTPHVIKYLPLVKKLYVGTVPSLIEIDLQTLNSTEIFVHEPNLVPMECLIFEESFMDLVENRYEVVKQIQLIVCYEDHGMLIKLDSDSPPSPLVWTEKAKHFSLYDDYLLIFSENYIEVREKETLWQTKQIIASPQQKVINPGEHYLVKDGSLMKIVLKS